jgi:hypothetical protein
MNLDALMSERPTGTLLQGHRMQYRLVQRKMHLKNVELERSFGLDVLESQVNQAWTAMAQGYPRLLPPRPHFFVFVVVHTRKTGLLRSVSVVLFPAGVRVLVRLLYD